MSNDRNEIRLILRPLADSVPWPNRVRMLLKIALRAFRLRCVRVEELPKESPTLAQETTSAEPARPSSE